ncbi:MAG: hypothetical protein QG633_160 [Patescibacteria group bacterium]|jgi:hypothetical protein|nr:hypothetical protein [Patescibacteria group bacterium]
MSPISLKKQSALVGAIALASLLPVHVLFADVFEPTSCEALYSTDLIAEMSHEVDYRIDGLTADDSTKKMFTTRGNATDPWTRSATVWTMEGDAPLDLTGASPWNSGSNFTKAGVLISPRHIVFAKHFPIANGSTVVFVADDNTIVTRTLQAQRSVVFQPDAGEDVQLGVLDSDVPASIAFYPVIPKEEMDRYLSEPQFPFLIFDQEAKANIEEINYSIGLANEHVYFNHAPATNPSTRFDFYEAQIGGDSGQPGFFFINNQPILALTVTGAGYGPFYGAYVDAINSSIVTLGNDAGYQMSTYDLSCFDVFNEVPEVTDETFSLMENSLEGTFVGTTTATDALGGDTLTYSISSGNTDSAFAIDEDTGAITINTESAIDFETNPSFELIVEATDNWWLSTAGTGTITINLQDELEAVAPTVLTVAASSVTSTEGTLNGSISATGGQDATFRGFIHGTSVSYGATTTEEGTFSTGAFSTTLSSLTCDTTYHFKAWASNPLGGISYGIHRTLTTLACEEEEEDDGGGGGGGGGGGSSSRKSDTSSEDSQIASPHVGGSTYQTIIIKLKDLISQYIILGGVPSQGMLTVLALDVSTTPTVAGSATFTRDLDVGMSGPDVTALQDFLITQKNGPLTLQLATNGATGLFGPLTQAALAEYQASVGITPAVGFFGPVTRVYINGL